MIERKKGGVMIDYPEKLKECGNEKLAPAMQSALSALFEKDRFLFENDVHERTITACLAFCMRASFTDDEFAELDIDPEYNKLGENPKRVVVDEKGRLVVPDIIVHERGNPTGANYLVIEAKCHDRGDTRQELASLELVKAQLEYRFALFIRFGIGGEAGQIREMIWV